MSADPCFPFFPALTDGYTACFGSSACRGTASADGGGYVPVPAGPEAPPTTEKRRRFSASVVAFHYTCLRRFCQPTKPSNPYPFPKNYKPQTHLPPPCGTTHTAGVVLSFSGRFQLAKSGIRMYNIYNRNVKDPGRNAKRSSDTYTAKGKTAEAARRCGAFLRRRTRLLS